MVETLLIALLAAGVGAAIAVALSSRRRTSPDDIAGAVRDELTVQISQQFDAQRHAMEQQRSESLRQAVESVVNVASEQLRLHTAAGTDALDHRNVVMAQRLDDMSQSLDRVRRLVTDLDQQRAEGFGQLAERLEQTGSMTLELSRTTAALREALASPQSRGQWGERMAEDVLRAAGFVRDVNYVVQSSTATGRPDFTFPLPAGRCVHMDVKFPLDNYVRHLEADTDTERAATLKAFIRDVRNRITELSRRDYVDPANGTLDQVLLFLPNEHVYGFLHQHDRDIIDLALKHKVVLCSPLTLFAVLAVIRQSVDDHLTERRSKEILDLLAAFGSQWEKFTDHLDKVGTRIAATQKAFDDANGVRRRMLEKQIDRVDDLRQASLSASHDDPHEAGVVTLVERATRAAG